MVQIFTDINCPFCFVQHERIGRLALKDEIHWCFVEHAPHLGSGLEVDSGLKELASDYKLASVRASDVKLEKPLFCINTKLPILSLISIQLEHPEIAADYLTNLYRSYWQRGKDISDSKVLKGILSRYGVMNFEIHPDAERILADSQKTWESNIFEGRIPAMSSADNRVMLGLQHIDNIKNFISNTPQQKAEKGLSCKAQEKSFIAVLNNPELINLLATNLSSCELFNFNNLSELFSFSESGTPDVIIIDFTADKDINFSSIESINDPESVFNEVSIVYYSKEDNNHDKVTAFMLGASDFLSSKDDIPVMAAKLKRRVMDSRKNRQLSRNAIIDSLTGLHNRRQFEFELERIWRISCRKQLPLSMLMIDVDHFKKYNDHYGHLEGDECLIKIANVIQEAAQRETDVIARFGGEEFVIILFDTDDRKATLIAEEIRLAIETTQISHENRPDVDFTTVSIGLCSLIPHADHSSSQVLEMADQALYMSKKEGRNRVTSVTMNHPQYLKSV